MYGHFVVLGAGRYGSGVFSACCLSRRGYRTILVDSAPLDAFPPDLLRLARAWDVAVLGGGNPQWIMDGAAGLVVAPSIEPAHPYVRTARQRGIPVQVDVELLLSYVAGPAFLVTGSNGKSTTASWLHHILRKVHPGTVLAGNIGIPAGRILLSTSHIEDPVVLEVSSFQGRYLQDGRSGFDYLVVTNFSPNHLDHHTDVEDYRRSKRGLVPIAGRAVVLNSDDYETANWAGDASSKALFFGRRLLGAGVFVKDGSVFWRSSRRDAVKITGTADLSLPGRHNLDNFMAAACAALASGIPPDVVREAAGDFRTLLHRLDKVGQVQGVDFYDDSAATCPESVIAALRTFNGRAVLIVGGKNKGFDLEPLARELTVAADVVLIGETSAELRGLLGGGVQVARDMDQAVSIALGKAKAAGGVPVVLSPGFASFDMFEDYRHRGEVFRHTVNSRMK